MKQCHSNLIHSNLGSFDWASSLCSFHRFVHSLQFHKSSICKWNWITAKMRIVHMFKRGGWFDDHLNLRWEHCMLQMQIAFQLSVFKFLKHSCCTFINLWMELNCMQITIISRGCRMDQIPGTVCCIHLPDEPCAKC